MFKVSRRLDYGLQMMIALATDTNGSPIATAELARQLDMPLPFLHQIGHSLMQAGLIKASPGPHGGLRLNQTPEDITVLHIVEALEGQICMNNCQDCSKFKEDTNCTIKPLWDQLQDNIVAYMSNINLSMLANDTKGLPNYTICLDNEKAKVQK
jgi:Rrf2 family protein